MSNKRTMLKDFKDSNNNVLFVQTKWYSYKIVKEGNLYRLWELEQESSLNYNSVKFVTLDYKTLPILIKGNIKFYEMDSYKVN